MLPTATHEKALPHAHQHGGEDAKKVEGKSEEGISEERGAYPTDEKGRSRDVGASEEAAKLIPSDPSLAVEGKSHFRRHGKAAEIAEEEGASAFAAHAEEGSCRAMEGTGEQREKVRDTKEGGKGHKGEERGDDAADAEGESPRHQRSAFGRAPKEQGKEAERKESEGKAPHSRRGSFLFFVSLKIGHGVIHKM